MAWTDPTDYSANAVPTTSGAEALNFNTKVTAKLRQLHNYFIGSDSETYFLVAVSGSDVRIKLSDASGGQFFTLMDSAGGTVLQFDSKGQLRAGAIDAEVIGVQFPGDQTVQTKVNNVRILAPYTFKATEVAVSCDDTQGVGASGTLRFVALAGGVAYGTVSIAPGNNTNIAVITATTISKNAVLTWNCTAIGGGAAPGRDVNIQTRGYRTGTIIL